MLSIQRILFFLALLHRSNSFAPSVHHRTRLQVSAGVSAGVSASSRQPLVALKLSASEEGEKDDMQAEDTPPKPDDSFRKPASDPTPPPQMIRTPPSPPPKRLDPLLASLTRVDPQAVNSNTPKTQIPLLGEVTLDKQLFIVVPIVAFAVLGFVSFFLVAFNSRDVFVDAINEWNDSVLNPPTPAPIDPNECRGLCSSQEQDLEGLRNFMNGLGGARKN